MIKNLKLITRTLLIICFICIVGIFFFLCHKPEKKFESTDGVLTVATLEDEIADNTIWCGTFQLVWNDLKNSLAKQDIVFSPQLKEVENLNKETFTEKDISDKYYYKKVALFSPKLKEEIEKGIKEKLNEPSDILNDIFSSSYSEDNQSYLLYIMLKKEFQFKYAFKKLKKGKFKNIDNVKYFGIDEDSDKEEVRNQVEVLYYNSDYDFAIKLLTKQEDEVILVKNPKGNTFNKIFKNITDKSNSLEGNTIGEDEEVKIPNINIKEKISFDNLENKTFYFSNGIPYKIFETMQTIDFELDRKGGRVKSEAGVVAQAWGMTRPRRFILDDTFALFLIEKGKKNPYLALKVDDISKFQ